MSAQRYVWNRKSQELNYAGQQYEHGAVFKLLGLRLDGLLIEHRYVIQLSRATKIASLPRCDACDRTFIDERYLRLHETGRMHPRSPNYEGEEARTSGERPPAREEVLYAAPARGRVPRVDQYNVPV